MGQRDPGPGFGCVAGKWMRKLALYWSSTELSAFDARLFNTDNGNQNNDIRDDQN